MLKLKIISHRELKSWTCPAYFKGHDSWYCSLDAFTVFAYRPARLLNFNSVKFFASHIFPGNSPEKQFLPSLLKHNLFNGLVKEIRTIDLKHISKLTRENLMKAAKTQNMVWFRKGDFRLNQDATVESGCLDWKRRPGFQSASYLSLLMLSDQQVRRT